MKNTDFSRRLRQLCDENPNIPPYGHGRLTYLADKTEVSQEAVRKWLSGDSRPRPNLMRKLARVLDADEAYLAVGEAPERDPHQRRMDARRLTAAVQFIYGLLTVSGAHCAFAAENDPMRDRVDLYAIIDGQQAAIHVALAEYHGTELEVALPPGEDHTHHLVVVPEADMRIRILDLTDALHDVPLKHRREGNKLTLKLLSDGYYLAGKKVREVRRTADILASQVH